MQNTQKPIIWLMILIFCTLEVTVKNIDHDLKKLSEWLNESKLSINVKKTELIIFRPHTKKLDHSFKFKLK